MDIPFKWAEKEPYEIKAELSVDASCLVEEGATFSMQPHINAILTHTKDHYEINGQLDATVMVPCSRCLELYPLEISRALHLVLLPRPQNPAAVEIGLGDEDMDTSFYSEQKVVLEDVVGEQINLALPMRPICKPDCKGLCLNCGTDLNRHSCTCPRQGSDS